MSLSDTRAQCPKRTHTNKYTQTQTHTNTQTQTQTHTHTHTGGDSNLEFPNGQAFQTNEHTAKLFP